MVSSSRDQGKATKGSVQIKNSNDRLQLVFSHAGKRRYLSLGFEDSIQNRKLAELRARQIELDLLSGNFDESLVKYKPESAPRTVTPDITPITPEVPALPSLDLLWEKYTEYKRPSLSPSTLAKDFIKVARCISVHLPKATLEDAVAIRDWLIANRSPNAAKRMLTQFSACCDWAKKSQLIPANPFEGMASDIRVPKGSSIACCDGLVGFPQSIEALYPHTQIQLCIVHLIRNCLRYVPWKDSKAVVADLKPSIPLTPLSR